MLNKVQSGTALERDLIQEVAEAKCSVLFIGLFLRCVRYGAIDHLSYLRMVFSCKGGAALFYLPQD